MREAKRIAESRKPREGALRIPLSALRFPPSALRQGISLVEILISMFVLLFGLMGVAAIFPVGNHYVVEGEKYDLGSSLAQNAFEELSARGILRPEFWHYSNLMIPDRVVTAPYSFVIQPKDPGLAAPDPGIFNVVAPSGPGHIFVLDPMSTAAGDTLALPNLDIFPYDDSTGSVDTSNPWNTAVPTTIFGTRWPIRRLTVLDTGGLMSTAVAETIFRLRDDLAVEQPEEDDWPSVQRWDLDGTTPLRRQYKGNYSWLATIVPSSDDALAALQTTNTDYGELRYDVSVVVFRKREVAPSATSERLIEAEFLNDGEIAIYAGTSDDVDTAVEDIRPGNWIAVAGVNQTTGDFSMKWYRILALDDETSDVTLPARPVLGLPIRMEQGRYLMLDGPDWPENSQVDLRMIIMPGVISVATQQLSMEDNSLWSTE